MIWLVPPELTYHTTDVVGDEFNCWEFVIRNIDTNVTEVTDFLQIPLKRSIGEWGVISGSHQLLRRAAELGPVLSEHTR